MKKSARNAHLEVPKLPELNAISATSTLRSMDGARGVRGASGRWGWVILGIFDGKFVPCLVQTLTEKKLEFLSKGLFVAHVFQQKTCCF